MKYNKFNAFTIAELMILLLTLSILMAAFAPVFTRRYNNASADKVWTYVAGDPQYDAYMDAINKTFTNQAFIGLTPVNGADVLEMSKDDNDNIAYSKLVIGASNEVKVNGTRSPQNQMQFRYSNKNLGSLVGSLFAGNRNILLGGPYKDITNMAKDNTAYGVGALEKISTGQGNTAVGVNAAQSMTTTKANTVVGHDAARKLNTGIGNTIIGNDAVNNTTNISSYNTIIGNNTAGSLSGSGANTIIGNDILTGKEPKATGNTLVGNSVMKQATSGEYNTAVGYNALSSLVSGDYNTVIGDNACMNVTKGSNKTCIGSYSGSTIPDSTNSHPSKLFNGDEERVFIGTAPVQAVGSSDYPGAVLEVHNVRTKYKNKYDTLAEDILPVQNAGNSSVVINGNLIVRGNTYLEAPIVRDSVAPETKTAKNLNTNLRARKGLMLFKSSDFGGKIFGFHGYDGSDRNGSSYGDCKGCKRHAYDDIRVDCICTSVKGGQWGSYTQNTVYDALTSDSARLVASQYGGSTSYDWNSKANNMNTLETCRDSLPATYHDRSYNVNVQLENRHEKQAMKKGVNHPLAHSNKGDMACCPDITSDVRLKNVGERYTAGLDELKRINIYNFTFKNDVNKLPQVGVIAQDLKLVFPNAVKKDADGFYKIRWDEMFYAAINSIKTLNSKIESVVAKVSGERAKVAALKKDNAELISKLDALSEELDKLEK